MNTLKGSPWPLKHLPMKYSPVTMEKLRPSVSRTPLQQWPQYTSFGGFVSFSFFIFHPME